MLLSVCLNYLVADRIACPKRIFFSLQEDGVIEFRIAKSFLEFLIPRDRFLERNCLRGHMRFYAKEERNKTFGYSFKDEIVQEISSFIVIIHHGVHELVTDSFGKCFFPSPRFPR